MKNWLITNAELREISNDYEWDWVLHKFLDNGITTIEDAFEKIKYTRFEYTNPDCPHCGATDKHYELNSELWKCKKCLKKFTITSGTYIENTKLEYYHIWRFCYLVGDLKIANSRVIAKDLGVTQLTAWRMIDTLRTARKEQSNKKFVNGGEVLVFDHIYEPLELLLKLRKNRVMGKSIKK